LPPENLVTIIRPGRNVTIDPQSLPFDPSSPVAHVIA
jgi:hypothetical protein